MSQRVIAAAAAGGAVLGAAVGAVAMYLSTRPVREEARSMAPEANPDPVLDASAELARRVESGEFERLEPNTAHTRETLLYPLIEGDVFDRQRCVDGWDTKNKGIEETVALVAGVGGVGSNVAMALARMGVGRIVLIDMDTVDATNLNRQILFTKYDVGKRKVVAAAENLEAMHGLGSRIETLDLDVVRNWDKVVAAAAEATVIFNCIDYGGVADKALASLAYAEGIPYVSASTYGNVFQNEFYTSVPGELCWRDACEGNMAASPSQLESLASERGVEVIDAESGAAILRDHFKVTDPLVKELFAGWLADLDAEALSPRDFYTLIIRGKYDKWLDTQLHPSLIRSHQSIEFIPADPHDTRGQGSWVVVCTVGTLLSVNLWVQHMLGYPTISSTVCDLRHFDVAAEFGPFTNFNAFAPAPSSNHPWATPVDALIKGKEAEE
ncbi:uncharacterized protein AMSG_05877 [Thecamonas trahens ATCC 50062]|uniref:THIF-type NAD/FAD binding fold domain-containing protein n=1 Tax=Thecamonas trahens ATCC 50062 TaxID=461836 RepID=A0A0L0DD28_THETB|nr:hypothetical protein AMSG_05877 [Thecamonas trahens ATCC 50062]KNC50105.1 hypothetical protein AMSG_05877 [Thecamonas trahens ATCC 50062]|eukprot:XP_013757264.1 hypothetical protein AMSG_05877 [Thecamonas trahens ATCC 50062]